MGKCFLYAAAIFLLMVFYSCEKTPGSPQSEKYSASVRNYYVVPADWKQDTVTGIFKSPFYPLCTAGMYSEDCLEVTGISCFLDTSVHQNKLPKHSAANSCLFYSYVGGTPEGKVVRFFYQADSMTPPVNSTVKFQLLLSV